MSEPGGVSTAGEVTYWWVEDDGWISAGFDTGHSLYFENDKMGWSSFLLYAIVLGKLY